MLLLVYVEMIDPARVEELINSGLTQSPATWVASSSAVELEQR